MEISFETIGSWNTIKKYHYAILTVHIGTLSFLNFISFIEIENRKIKIMGK